MTNEILPPLFIKGLPAAFAASREVWWKETVADAIEAVWSSRDYVERPCEVLLEFHLPPDKAAITDVDNLLKPTIDALGAAIFRPALRGHRTRWNADDHWIYRFVAEKFAAVNDDEVGLRICVNELAGESHVQTSQ